MIELDAHPKKVMDESSLPSANPDGLSVSPKQQIIERRLSLVTPEIAEQVDIEMGYVENWAAFRAHDPLVKRLYDGESLDVDADEMLGTFIIPAYREQQVNLVKESKAIADKVIPDLQDRLSAAEGDAHTLDENVAQSEAERLKAQPNQRIASALESYKRQAKNRHKDIRDLTGDIQKSRLSKQIKDTTVTSIEHFLSFSSPEELAAKADAILVVAKKEALAEVIGQLKQDQIAIDAENDENDEQIVSHTARIQALEMELELLEELHPTVEHDWSKNSEHKTEPEAAVSPVRATAQEAYTRLRQSRIVARGSAAVASIYKVVSK